MNKKEAIEKMVQTFSSISQDQFKTLQGDNFQPLPMWGTMWRMDYFGEDLYNNARVMQEEIDEVLENEDFDEKVLKKIKKAQASKDDNEIYVLLDNYIDESMGGARCILDKEGNTTAMYIYELDGEYWLGVNGAGWDFYVGVWDKLYNITGLKWHDAK